MVAFLGAARMRLTSALVEVTLFAADVFEKKFVGEEHSGRMRTYCGQENG